MPAPKRGRRGSATPATRVGKAGGAPPRAPPPSLALAPSLVLASVSAEARARGGRRQTRGPSAGSASASSTSGSGPRSGSSLSPQLSRSHSGRREGGGAELGTLLRSSEHVRPAVRIASASTMKTVRLLPPLKLAAHEEHFAASTGQTNWLQICLQKSETPTQADINGFSALHLASLHGRLDCMKMLIERYHVDMDLVSTTGWRPIHLVMGRESEGRALECLQYLIRKGAEVNVKNQNGVTPLHKAASEGREDCIRVLIEAGADVHAKDAEGQEPIDLCKMWGHRACAKCLASAMWKRDKADFAQEVRRLNELKEECQIREKDFLKREQREMDFVNNVAYTQWLEKKGLPAPSDRILGYLKKKRVQSVSLRQPTEGRLSAAASPASRALGVLSEAAMQKDQLRPSWNISTNVCSAPATSILRPSTIRVGVQPEKPLEHDFTSFLLLFRDRSGKPEIYVNDWGKVSTVPDLPFEVVQKSIYPHAQIARLEGAQDFRPKHIFDVASKRHPSPEHWWTDQMALSLRETLDPAFVGALQAHLATYTDPSAVFPGLAPDSTSGQESSTPSQASSQPS
ncbi:hypothetical protein lerEdw1_019917 [Lerista edwardsae]|nr:hypothetical protein lerEdw1_019917 [Lerista edwardsae]